MTAGPTMESGTLLVLGGARSGKTRRALDLCETLHAARGLTPVYIATGQAHDAEMAERIAAHKAERGAHWTTVEAPLELADAVAREGGADRVLLIDCLTLWVTNLLLAERDLDDAGSALIEALTGLAEGAAGPAVVVSNEVGLGIVPDNALARRFRDAAGRLNQRVAAQARRVEFVAAGLPTVLKDETRDA